MQDAKSVQYNVAKPWQLYVFSVHDVMLNCFLYTMGFISYLATGYYGLLATTAAVIATGSRIFDAITDPMVAFIIERTDGRFGRYRPMMALGWLLHRWPSSDCSFSVFPAVILPSIFCFMSYMSLAIVS